MALDPALLAKMKASKNKYARGGNTVKLKEGKTTIRILQKGSDIFWKEIGVHWIKTEKEGKPVAVVGCHDEVYGKPCSVCAAAEKAMPSGTDEEKAIMKEWRAKKSVLVAALIRTGADASAEPQLLELTGTTWGKISGTIEEYQAAGVDMLDPNEGVDLIIERTGRGLNTDYSVMVAPGKSKPVAKDILERLPSFDDYVDKELFKGDERKALTAIGNFSGVSVSGLTALTSSARSDSTTRRLTSSVVEDAVIEEPVSVVVEDTELAEVAEVLAADETPVETDDEREERELAQRMAALKAKKEASAKADLVAKAKIAAEAKAKADALAKAKVAKTTTVMKPAEKDAFVEPSTDDIEAMLAELDA